MGLGASGRIRKIAAPLLSATMPTEDNSFKTLTVDVASVATKYAIGIASGAAAKEGGKVRFTTVRGSMMAYCGNYIKSFGYSDKTTNILIARDGEQLPIKAITAAKRAATISKTDLPESLCSADEPYAKRRAIAREFVSSDPDEQPGMTVAQVTAIINLARSPVCDIMCSAIRAAVMGTDVTEHTIHPEGEATAFYLALDAARDGTSTCIVANDTDIFGLMIANWDEIVKIPSLWYYDVYAGKFINASEFCKAAATDSKIARATLLAWMMRGTDYFPPCLGEKETDWNEAYATVLAYVNDISKQGELESYLSARLRLHGERCKTATFIPHSGRYMLMRMLTVERVFMAKTVADLPDFFAPDSGWGKTADGMCVPREWAASTEIIN